jgi:hypothetical protein
MDRQYRSKLNQMLVSWPKGTVAVYSFFGRFGVARQLAAAYQKNGWIKSIGQGAFVRADDKDVSWAGGVYALQEYERSTVHIGGLTALEHFGYSNTINTGGHTSVFLYADQKEKLPSWFKKWKEDVHISFNPTNLFPAGDKDGITEKVIDGCKLSVSAPERAMMEVLYSMPLDKYFSGAKALMEGLNSLRPDLVQTLLEKCNSIKVKRLFMFLAELCNHEWAGQIDVKNISFGTGKRMIVKNGVLDKKYYITVPRGYSIEK